MAVTINLESANGIVDYLDGNAWQPMYEQLRDAIRDHAEFVTSELAVIQELRYSDPVNHAQNCLLFAMLSPQTKFDVNVRSTRRILDRLYDDFASVQDVWDVLTAQGTDNFFTSGNGARAIFRSLETLRNIDADCMTVDGIKALVKSKQLFGLGPKTRAMALALFDENSDVFTLDVWMLRGISETVGYPTDGQMFVKENAYAVLERAFVDWIRAECPYSVFAVQWMLWNHFRNGTHETHLPIFGIVS